MRTFAVGEVYFRITYPDRNFLYPGVESFVYLGKNLSDEDTEDTWYFQPATDYGRYGSAVAHGAVDRPVVCLGQSDISEMEGLPTLISEIQAAAARRAIRSSKAGEMP